MTTGPPLRVCTPLHMLRLLAEWFVLDAPVCREIGTNLSQNGSILRLSQIRAKNSDFYEFQARVCQKMRWASSCLGSYVAIDMGIASCEATSCWVYRSCYQLGSWSWSKCELKISSVKIAVFRTDLANSQNGANLRQVCLYFSTHGVSSTSHSASKCNICSGVHTQRWPCGYVFGL